MRRLFIISLMTVMSLPVFAAKRYWIATTTANWNSTANWSLTNGGAGGATVPGSTDTAYFTSTRVGSCSLNATVSVRRLEMQTGYTGTLTQAASVGITVGTGGVLFAAGTFTGGSSSIVFNSSCTFSGTSFTSTSGSLFMTQSITLSGGTFSHNNGTVEIRGTSATITGNFSFYNLRLNPTGGAGTFTISSGTTLTANATLTFAASSTNTLQLNTGTINAKGDVVLSGSSTGNGGNALISINGTGSQTLQGGSSANVSAMPNVAVNKSSGTLSLTNTVCITGYFSYQNGVISAGSSTVSFLAPSANNTSNNFVDPASPNGSVVFNHVAITGGTRTVSGGTLETTGNLTIASGATFSPGANGVNVGGDWSNSGTYTAGTSTTMFNGSSYQKISKSSGTEVYYHLRVNKPGGSLTLNCPVSASSLLTLTNGKMKTSATNYFTLLSGATVSGGGDNAYVHGEFRRTGTGAFTFPLGDTSLSTYAYHPLSYTGIPIISSATYAAAYYASGQTQGSSFDQDSLEEVSNCEYWTIQRISGTTISGVTLNWNGNNCVLEGGPAAQRIARWNGSTWLNDGNSGYTVNGVKGTVSTGVLNSFSSLTYVTLARKKEDQYFILNTRGMDSLIGSDSVKYRISGPQLSGIYKAGRVKTFKPYTPHIGNTSTVYLKFFQGSGTDTTTVQFDIDHYAKVTNVKVTVDVLAALDTNFYDVISDTLLALMNDRNTYAEQLIPPVYVQLEGGVRMSPDGDSSYDTFVVSGASGYTTYQLVISDALGNQIFSTTNPASAWNGLDGGGVLVPQGSYNYKLTLDGNVLTGLFLVEY